MRVLIQPHQKLARREEAHPPRQSRACISKACSFSSPSACFYANPHELPLACTCARATPQRRSSAAVATASSNSENNSHRPPRLPRPALLRGRCTMRPVGVIYVGLGPVFATSRSHHVTP